MDRVKEDEILYTMILGGLVGRYAQDIPYIESSPMSREDYGNIPNLKWLDRRPVSVYLGVA